MNPPINPLMNPPGIPSFWGHPGETDREKNGNPGKWLPSKASATRTVLLTPIDTTDNCQQQKEGQQGRGTARQRDKITGTSQRDKKTKGSLFKQRHRAGKTAQRKQYRENSTEKTEQSTIRYSSDCWKTPGSLSCNINPPLAAPLPGKRGVRRGPVS